MSDSRRDFGLEIGFIDHFDTRLVIILKYSTIVDFRTLQIPTAHAVFTCRSLVTASDSGDSPTVPTKSSLHKFPYNSLLTHSVATG
jgi:hypothetical protein